MMRNLISTLTDCSEDLVKDLIQYSDGLSSFDLLKSVSKCTLDMLISSAYGFKMTDVDDKAYEEYIEATEV
jgi:hypothetical protein